MAIDNYTPEQIEEILQAFFEVAGTRQYIGARYVPIFGRGRGTPIEWDNSDAYEPLSIVYYQGDTYTSRRYVPAGIAIDNQDYWVITGRYNAQVEQYRQEVLSFQGQINDLRDDLESDYVPFPDTDHYPKYGTLGQVLSTLADGTTKWEDPVVPSDAQAEAIITAWLEDHPEATTTVQDGSLTYGKFADSLKNVLMWLAHGAATSANITDANLITTPSIYSLTSTTGISNLPTTVPGNLVTLGGTRNPQLYITTAGKLYTRGYTSSTSTWSAWVISASVAESLTLKVNSGTSSTIPDVDDLHAPGMYNISNYTGIANLPASRNGTLYVDGATNTTQMYVSPFFIYLRSYRNSTSTWSQWRQLATVGESPMLYGVNTSANSSVIPDANGADNNSFYQIGDYTSIANLPASKTGTLVTFGDTRNKTQLYIVNDNIYIRWYRYSTSAWQSWFSLSPEYAISDCIMPATLNAIVGKVYQLDLYNIYNEINIDNLLISNTPRNAVVSYREQCIRLAPTTAGDTSITLESTNGIGTKSKTFTMHAVSDATKPSVKAIFIGDSLTNMGYYLAELKTMMGNDLTLYGTQHTTAPNSEDVDVTVDHEGRSGWGLYDMLYRLTYKDANNAFYNPSTSQFDFSYYITQNPTFYDVSDVYIFSGPNDGDTPDYITYLQTMCASIRAYNASIRIHICTPTPPNRSGYGFGHTNNYSYLIFKTYMYTHAKDIITTFDGESGYFIVPTHSMLDCYYDYPKTTIQVNPRNPETIEVGNNNVHPNKYGFYRIADTIYADMIANCS